jgi:hypothetical protein
MKKKYLLLLAMTILVKAAEPGKDKPFFTQQEMDGLKIGGIGSDAGMKAFGGSHAILTGHKVGELWVQSASSMYTNISPSVKSAVENTIKVGVGATASYIGYKVGRPIYNHFRPSLEEQVRRSSLQVQLEENKKKMYELEQERFAREKVQQKMHAVNELSKCAYNNSSSSHIDSRGVPLQCSSADFRLVMYHDDGYKYSYDIGRKIKILRGEKVDGQ